MGCAIITGITGQDGAYLAELQLGKGYTAGVGMPMPSRMMTTVATSSVSA